MGKGARNRTKAVEARSAVEIKNFPNKRLTALIVSACALLLAIAIAAVYIINSGALFRKKTAIGSERYTVTAGMSNYLFATCYQNDMDTMSEYYINTLGFNTSVPLKQQTLTDSDGQTKTWHKYFLDLTTNYIGEALIYAEAALDNGLKLDDTDYNKINKIIDELRLSAKQENMSFNRYLRENYGKGVKEEDVRRSTELMLMAEKQIDYLNNSFSPSDTEIEEYYQENRKYIDSMSYISYSFSGSTAKSRADKAAKAKNIDQFKKYIINFIKSNTSNKTDYAALKEYESHISKDVFYSENSDTMNWIYDSKRKSGDTYVETTNNSSTVYFVISPAERNTKHSVNVRHILLTAETYSNSTAAKYKAQELLSEWQRDKTIKKFEELASKYSEDTETAKTGGLYSNYRAGDIENAYEFDEWCFATNRQAGDVEIISSEYGAHLMYIESMGLAEWKLTTKEYMLEELTQKYNKEYFEKYPIFYEEAILNEIG